MKAFGKVSVAIILSEILSEQLRVSSRTKKTTLHNHYKAPRSMTPDEQAHYAIHKNLNNFYPSQKH